MLHNKQIICPIVLSVRFSYITFYCRGAKVSLEIQEREIERESEREKERESEREREIDRGEAVETHR